MYFYGSKFCGLCVYNLEEQCAQQVTQASAHSKGTYGPDVTAYLASQYVGGVTW
jgi:hypothetical protein